jgi:hypothetical protein
MKTKRLFLILTALVLISPDCGAEEISGVVTSFGMIPLNKVSVKSLKTGNAANTDSLGKFSINVMHDDVLLISASGFVSRKIKIKDNTRIFINLKYAFTDKSRSEVIENGHMTAFTLDGALRKYHGKDTQDFSRYHTIYELIRAEFHTLRVDGTNIYNTQAISFSMSQQVTYVVDNIIATDISYIRPSEVRKIELIDGPDAAEWGIRGANGVLRIYLRGAN